MQRSERRLYCYRTNQLAPRSNLVLGLGLVANGIIRATVKFAAIGSDR